MKLLATLLLCLSALLGKAQNVPGAGPAASYTPTHADSLDLLHGVFRRSRHMARFGTFASALVVGSNTAGSLSNDYNNNHSTLRALNITSAALYSYFLVESIVDWRRYSQRREADAVRRFEQHQAQPRYVQRRMIMAVAQAQIRQLNRR